MKSVLEALFNRKSLSLQQAEYVMNMMSEGKMSTEHMCAILAALRTKGESVQEIAGFALSLLEHAIILDTKRSDLIDTCGTGGDNSQTFNVSTTVSFVVAGAGVGVAKHGNRSISSQCGSADVLEELGIPINLSPEQVASMVDEIGFGFLFAPNFHPAFKYITPIRKALGVKTIFNILGPLVNPARLKNQIIGVFDQKFIETMAQALIELKIEEAMVVSSEDGLDEFSIAAPTHVAHLKNGKVTNFIITPEEVGLTRARMEDLRGGDKAFNAQITRNILEGELGPKRDIVLFNAGAALMVAGKCGSIREGIELAKKSIDSGAAMEILKKAKAFV